MKSIIYHFMISGLLFQGTLCAVGTQEFGVQVDHNDMILSAEEFGVVLKEVLEAESGAYAKQMKAFLMQILKGENLINVNLRAHMAQESGKLLRTIQDAQPQLIGASVSTTLRKLALIVLPLSSVVEEIAGSDYLEMLNKIIETSELIEHKPSQDSKCGSPSIVARLAKGVGEIVEFVGNQVDSAINLVAKPVVEGLRSINDKKDLIPSDVERILNSNDENFKVLFKDYIGKVVDMLKLSYDQFLNDDQRNLVSSAFLNFKNNLLRNSKSNTLISDALLTPDERKLKETMPQGDKCDIALQNALVVLFSPRNNHIKVPKLAATVKTTSVGGFNSKTSQGALINPNQEKDYNHTMDTNYQKLTGVFEDIVNTLNIMKDSNKQAYTQSYNTMKIKLEDISNKFKELPVVSEGISTSGMTTSVLSNNRQKMSGARFQRSQK